ncbi:MAG: hypothetical protein Q8L48_33720 [Archangium sp.]|nr:hypothetical protein [Archangium sp.]
MELLFVVEHTFWLDGVGLVLAPGMPLDRPLVAGTPLFLVSPRGTHMTAMVRPLPTLPSKSPTVPIAVDLAKDEVPVGTRVFGRPAPS